MKEAEGWKGVAGKHPKVARQGMVWGGGHVSRYQHAPTLISSSLTLTSNYLPTRFGYYSDNLLTYLKLPGRFNMDVISYLPTQSLAFA